MNLKNTLMLGLLALVATGVDADNATDSLTLTTIVEHPITSVKNQSRSGTCWAFSSLGFFEAELLRINKKSYDLSESFLIFKTMIDRGKGAVRMHGDISFSQGGSFYDAVYCLRNYGICPENAMPKAGSLYGDTLYNHSELDMIARAYIKAITESNAKKLSNVWCNGLVGLYESYLGKIPESFSYEGKDYTPKSFAESLGLKMDDYVSLTSFTHHPFYSQFAIEVQDNWRWGLSYNLPLDEFMEVMESAIKNGYTFAWGADVSESNFRATGKNEGLATIPNIKEKQDLTGSDQAHWIGAGNKEQAEKDVKGERIITPEIRQEGFDNWTTTDDHGMLIYGLAKHQNGKEYFMMKNSWGKYNKLQGYGYISKAYMAYKTINILVHKDAIPKKIAKKLGL